jgi:cyclopropane-fatty-acyl-phospholipid synthase
MSTHASDITMTQDNSRNVLRDLPFAARQTFNFALKLTHGQLRVQLPDGRILRFETANPGPHAMMVVHDLHFADHFTKGGDIGLAEAFLRGEWDTPDLTEFLRLFCINHEMINQILADKPVIRWLQLLRHWFNRNTKAGSKRNIHAHYDLGNLFYDKWLDRSMTYSSALFKDGDDLAAAQQRKYETLARDIGITEQDHVLEIGCGWGGFAEYAAKTIGCRLTGLTISQEQFDYAQQRMFEQGLNEKVTLKFQDYRDETGRYDHVASIEMFEAVGEEFWPVYFRKVSDCLEQGGKAGLQVITIQDRFFETYRKEMDFIRRYIFPGGMLPCPRIMNDLGASNGLQQIASLEFGHDYARTLSLWRDNFRAVWPELTVMGFDERFRRMWEYYLAYCEAGFLAGNIDVRQIVYQKA